MISVFERKEECCGCTACEHICPVKAIKMLPDQEGFLYPIINQEECIDCRCCKKICPFQNKIYVDNKLDEPLVYAVKHKKFEIRMKSASGGAYTEISNIILDKSGSVYGVKFDENFKVVHSKAANAVDRNKFRGSKYIQSDLGNTFVQVKKDLDSGQKVLFTGTGCQAAGLRMYLKDTETNTDSLIFNDIICHGTASPILWDEYLKFIQKNNKLVFYTFRCKEKGWHGYNIKAEYENGKCIINTSALKVYANLYSSGFTLRPSCYNCKFTNLNRISDITIGDFWGIEKTMPDIDDDTGISLVLVNTSKGKITFDNIKENLEVWESNTQNCLQPNLIRPTKRPEKRDIFWHEYYDNGFKYIAKKYAGYNLKSIAKKNLKAFLKITGLTKLIKK